MNEENQHGRVLCRLPFRQRGELEWALFSNPRETISVHDTAKALQALTEVEETVAGGAYAAGFVAYEAAAAFDPANATRPANEDHPIVWFGIYDSPKAVGSLEDVLNAAAFETPSPPFKFGYGELTPELSEAEYLAAAERVLEYIREGDIYQANLTFRQKLTMTDSLTLDLFAELMRSHPVPYGAFVETPDVRILSISPELFLNRRGDTLTTIPMKGTAPRATTESSDAETASALAADEKNRAENLMIVDMARNDLGRICVPGSIRVDKLFEIETYESLHQMVSVVRGKVLKTHSLTDIFKATFPAASITGAPKIRAMEVIRELERSPRGVYTGSIGCLSPDGDFLFNVAIRTLSESYRGIEIGIGGGVVADSVPKNEWEECLLKSDFIRRHLRTFDLLETMLWRRQDSRDGAPSLRDVDFLEEHLARLKSSAECFGFKIDISEIRAKLAATLKSIPISANFARLRLTLSRDGRVAASSQPLESTGWGPEPLKLAVSNIRVDSRDPLLRHKTTSRKFRDDEFRLAIRKGMGEILFLNERDEITEGAISNVFVRKGLRWKTPALECGLLPGLFRAKLIDELRAEEASVGLDELRSADEVLICNSVRGAGRAAAALDEDAGRT